MFVLEDNDCICPKIGLKPTSQKKEGYRPGTRRFRLICSLPTAGTTLLNTTSPLYLTRKSPWTDTREASLPSEQSRSEGPRPLAAGPASSRDRRHLPRPRGDGGPHACNPPRTQMPPPLPKAQRRDGDTQASGPQPCQLHGCVCDTPLGLYGRTRSPRCRGHPDGLLRPCAETTRGLSWVQGKLCCLFQRKALAVVATDTYVRV